MTKPIDWTKPLRVVGTHERIDRVVIWRDGRRRVSAGRYNADGLYEKEWPVSENGQPCAGFDPALAVENIPPEPRIVERWALVRPITTGGYYFCYDQAIYDLPPKKLDSGDRIARVLIEEPGE